MHPTARPSRYELHPQLADDTAPVIELALCEVRLMDDANHPWLMLVPKVPDAVELIDLTAAQRTLLTAEIDDAAHVLKALFQPDKLNVAAPGLGRRERAALRAGGTGGTRGGAARGAAGAGVPPAGLRRRSNAAGAVRSAAG